MKRLFMLIMVLALMGLATAETTLDNGVSMVGTSQDYTFSITDASGNLNSNFIVMLSLFIISAYIIFYTRIKRKWYIVGVIILFYLVGSQAGLFSISQPVWDSRWVDCGSANADAYDVAADHHVCAYQVKSASCAAGQTYYQYSSSAGSVFQASGGTCGDTKQCTGTYNGITRECKRDCSATDRSKNYCLCGTYTSSGGGLVSIGTKYKLSYTCDTYTDAYPPCTSDSSGNSYCNSLTNSKWGLPSTCSGGMCVLTGSPMKNYGSCTNNAGCLTTMKGICGSTDNVAAYGCITTLNLGTSTCSGCAGSLNLKGVTLGCNGYCKLTPMDCRKGEITCASDRICDQATGTCKPISTGSTTGGTTGDTTGGTGGGTTGGITNITIGGTTTTGVGTTKVDEPTIAPSTCNDGKKTCDVGESYTNCPEDCQKPMDIKWDSLTGIILLLAILIVCLFVVRWAFKKPPTPATVGRGPTTKLPFYYAK